jgi:hypothetical protein
LSYEDLLLLTPSDDFAVKLFSVTLVVRSILVSVKASVLLLTAGDSGKGTCEASISLVGETIGDDSGNGTCEGSISLVGDSIGDDSVTDIEGVGE